MATYPLYLITSAAQHRKYLKEMESLIKINPNKLSTHGKRLSLIAVIIDEYEKKRFPIDYPHPIEAIKFRMEQQDLKQKDLIKYLGSRQVVSKVLARIRPLSLQMIRNLHKGLGIPAQVLIQEIKIKKKRAL